MVLLYIDPGSGSLIIQALIAGAIALPILLKTQLLRALSVLRRGSGRQQPTTDEPAE